MNMTVTGVNLDEIDDMTLATTHEPIVCADCAAIGASLIQCNAWHRYRTVLARLADYRTAARGAEVIWANDPSGHVDGFTCPACHLGYCGIGHQDVCEGEDF